MTQGETNDYPTHLYKYRSLAGDSAGYVKDILTNNRLYWPSPLQFNDPFDCYPIPELPKRRGDRAAYIRGAIERSNPGISQSENRRQFAAMMRDDLAGLEAILGPAFRNRVNEMGVCSFAETGESVLMWSHYADSHRGVCLRFKPTIADEEYLVGPVTYSIERPVLDMSSEDMMDWGQKILLTKADYWAYEREWRAFDVLRSGLHPFRPEMLDAVIFGALTSKRDQAAIESWLADRPAPTKLLRARFDQGQFRLHIEPTP